MSGGDPFAGLPRKHFAAIVADPPWHFRARTALQVGNWTSRRDAEKHYPVMGVDDIKAMPVRIWRPMTPTSSCGLPARAYASRLR